MSLSEHSTFGPEQNRIRVKFDLLKEYFSSYKTYLIGTKRHPELQKWDLLEHFQNNWDLSTEQPSKMYAASIDSNISRRWWKSPSFNPREVMMLLLEGKPRLMLQAFEDLFREDSDAADRMDRFIFYCDEALKAYKEVHPGSIVNHHYHTSNHMVSLYLSLAHPDRYSPYFHETFLSFLKTVKSRELPKNRDPQRFFTLCNTLQKLLLDVEGMPDALQTFYQKNDIYFDDCNHPFLAQDFMHFVGKSWSGEN